MRVLLIDDEPDILKQLTRHLEHQGFEVDAERDPHRALERMHEQLYSIVVTDVHLPGLSGFAMIRELKAINPLANVLVITGYPSMTYMVDSLSAGAADFFTKPIQRMDLFLEAMEQCRGRVERWQGAISMGSDDAQSFAG